MSLVHMHTLFPSFPFPYFPQAQSPKRTKEEEASSLSATAAGEKKDKNAQQQQQMGPSFWADKRFNGCGWPAKASFNNHKSPHWPIWPNITVAARLCLIWPIFTNLSFQIWLLLKGSGYNFHNKIPNSFKWYFLSPGLSEPFYAK
jgi:hypothetical protein